MKKQLAIWNLISKSLKEKIPVMLLYVVESYGSSPGRQGFFMAVNAEGVLEGSVGGGIMEHKFVEMAKQRLKHHSKETLVKKQVHDKNAGTNKSGMICSGEQTILLYIVQKKDAEVVKEIIKSLKNNKIGLLKISHNGIEFSKGVHTPENFSYKFISEDEWHYTENVGYRNHLYIVGGGHCALALSKLMSNLNFCIHLFDNREELNTMQKNKSVHEKKYLKNYTTLAKHIPSGQNNYVVIMTFGYRTDDEALRSIFNKSFKYLGVLGSSKKIEKMFDQYKTEGFDENILKKIHAPVGLQIKSRTPEEIAVSIAAEIIKVKNRKPLAIMPVSVLVLT